MPEPTQDALRDTRHQCKPEDKCEICDILRHAALRPTEPAQGECPWMDDGEGVWATGCDQEWTFIAEGPAENKVRFCPYCGGTLAISQRTERIDLGDGV